MLWCVYGTWQIIYHTRHHSKQHIKHAYNIMYQYITSSLYTLYAGWIGSSWLKMGGSAKQVVSENWKLVLVAFGWEALQNNMHSKEGGVHTNHNTPILGYPWHTPQPMSWGRIFYKLLAVTCIPNFEGKTGNLKFSKSLYEHGQVCVSNILWRSHPPPPPQPHHQCSIKVISGSCFWEDKRCPTK